MGQYQKHLYGSTLYGEMDVFYGQYITESFDAEEKFTGAIAHNISALLPTARYKPDTYETKLSEGWTINSSRQAVTTSATDTFTFKAGGSLFDVYYKTQQGGPQTLRVQLQKKDGTILYSQDIETYSLSAPSVKKHTFPMVPYQTCFVVGTVPTGAGYGFTLDSVEVVTANVDVEVRCSADNSTWTEWEKVSASYEKEIATNLWTLTGTGTVTYNGIQYIQGRLTLVTSEQESAPIVQRVELKSGDSSLRAEDGEWIGTFDMSQIATKKGIELGKIVQFQKAVNIRWTENVPANTRLTIRSSSSYEGEIYGPITAPYKKNTKRLRLKDGTKTHRVLIGPINPIAPKLNSEGKNTKANWTIKSWTHWTNNSYMPRDDSGVFLRYVFSQTPTDIDNAGNKLQEIHNPMYQAEDGESNRITFNENSFYLTVVMEIGDDKATPVVDLLDLYCTIDYVEAIPVNNKLISAVDSANTGILKLQTVSDTIFLPPPVLGENTFNVSSINSVPLKWQLDDKTARPTDVQVYLKSEENTVDRKRIATTNTDEIYGKVFHRPPSGGTGVQMHYQYNGGTVQYLKPRTEEMDSSFTPAIKDLKKKYKYYIVNGWPQEYHIAQPGQTLSDVAVMNGTTEAAIRAAMLSKKLRVQENTDGTLVSGKMVYLPNNSLNPVVETSYLNETDYTTKSSHNARVDKLTDLTSEKIKIEVPTSPEHNYTEWVSEEKIYDGVVNYNDIPMNYSRRQLATLQTSSLEREYTVLNGDTWSTIAKKHIVNLDDLMLKNKVITLTAGQKVVVPANILLPYIEHGVEFDTLNPFEVTIVDNSVQKKDGTPLDKALIPVDWSASTLPLQVWYKASSPVTVEIKRGNIPNDRDALKHRRVLQITNVKKKNGMRYTSDNYRLVDDYIDWSPAQDLSSEPAADETYVVTYIYEQVDYAIVTLGTTYVEETGVDIVWRSTETKTADGICSPGQDALIPLPAMDTFSGYGAKTVKDYTYIVEDNDLWVDTSVVDVEGIPHILGTLKNRNPKENWFPLITPGFYYLKEEEFYMYSETLETPLEEKEIPIAKNVSYVPTAKDMGIRLEPSRSNLITNSTLENKDWKTAGTFNFKTV